MSNRDTATALRLVQIGVRESGPRPSMGSSRSAGIGLGAALRAEKLQMRYLGSEVLCRRGGGENMRMVSTSHLNFALGIEQVRVGGYMRLTVMYFFGGMIATISDLSVKRRSRVTACCAGPSEVSHAGHRPNRRSTSLDQNARKAHYCITVNHKAVSCKVLLY